MLAQEYQGLGLLIIAVSAFIVTGAPTYFVTRKYGANLKRDWFFLVLPTLIILPFSLMVGYDRIGIGGVLGQTLGSTMIPSVIALWIFSTKKKKPRSTESNNS